ncbi:hypothetical protein [Pedobacter miscanthi]|uniref:hypothetical protein n=1 Tax=Pedobacter miscanthi TaxID=2259170 RepID=UPI00292D4B4D|nr:hypothetical protein [Pedobacter miscanthi]
MVKDFGGTYLPNVSILLQNEQNLIIASCYTSDKGAYSLALPKGLNRQATLFVSAACLGFKKKRFQFMPGKLKYDFVLEIDPIMLSEVKIQRKPSITKSGDTLSYEVNSFARTEDRSIGDVISHLPGVTVDNDGRISFNGTAIANLFIAGDDLMDGRYGLATKSISKDMIKSVEVLKNHQPIKVLKDKVLTDDVSMNLVLKDDKNFKISGEGTLGLGIPSKLDATVNLIGLNKTIKVLNSLKANNTGVDYRNDFKKLSSNTSFNSDDFSKPGFITNAGTTGMPDLPRNSYYINKSGAINLNNLVNTKKEIQLRVNIQGFLDRNSLFHRSNVINYLPEDTIGYSEQQIVTQKTAQINTGLSVGKNTAKLFFNNSTNINLSRDQYHSPLKFNGLDFNQVLDNTEYAFSNSFSYIPRLKKGMVFSLKWNLDLFSNPQNLFIDEGINPQVINDNLPYKSLRQQSEIPTFFSDISSSLIIPNTHVKQSYQLGISNEIKQLNSKISIVELDNKEADYKEDAGNALEWKNNKIYFKPNLSLKTELWQVILTAPVQFQEIYYKQADYSLNSNFLQLTVNPNASINLKTSDENYINATLNYTNNVGDINSIYKGNILTNYRTLNSNNTDLQVKKSWGLGVKYHLEKSISLAISNVGFNYNEILANTIAFTSIRNDIQQTILVPLKNKSTRTSANLDFSKYFFDLKAKIQISANYSNLKTNLFLNNQLLPYANNNINLSFGYDSKILNRFTLNYNFLYQLSKTKQKADEALQFTSSVQRLNHSLSLGYNIKERFFWEAISQYTVNNLANNTLSDFFLINSNLKYRVLVPRLDLSLEVSNLLNRKSYNVTSLNYNQFGESIFDIRGTMVIFRLSYIF